MVTSAEIEKQFRAELQALLNKWGAEIEARDYWQGYAECGEDVRMTAVIGAVYDGDRIMLRPDVEINLGGHLRPKVE